MAQETQRTEKGKTFILNAIPQNWLEARSGYTFLGWNTDRTALTAQYIDGDDVIGGFAEDTTLFAIWQENVPPHDPRETKVTYIDEDVRYFNIPGQLTRTAVRIFTDYGDILKVEIGTGITTIGQDAFYGCMRLTEAVIPGEVQSIGQNVFEGCAALSSVTIGLGVRNIERFAFGRCGNLTEMEIPQSVHTIAAYAFNDDRMHITLQQSKARYGNYGGWGLRSGSIITDPDGDYVIS